MLDGYQIHFVKAGTWRITEKLTEKTCQDPYLTPCESVAVFVCEKVTGSDVGKEAIVKIRLEYNNLNNRFYVDTKTDL